MLYMICRADQIPMNFARDKPMMIKPSSFYPRIVWATSPEGAIDRAFQPEPYQPGGKRDLIVIELGENYHFAAFPIPPSPPPPTYTLQCEGRNTRLNAV